MTKAAKLVSDAEYLRQPCVEQGYCIEPRTSRTVFKCRYCEIADTIERLQKIEQRAKLVKYQNLTPNGVHLPCDVASYILAGDQLQGGSDK